MDNKLTNTVELVRVTGWGKEADPGCRGSCNRVMVVCGVIRSEIRVLRDSVGRGR